MDLLKTRFYPIAKQMLSQFDENGFQRKFKTLNAAIDRTLKEMADEKETAEKKLAVAIHALKDMEKQDIYTQEGKLYVKEQIKNTLSILK